MNTETLDHTRVSVAELRALLEPVMRSWVEDESPSEPGDGTPGLNVLALRSGMAPRTLRRLLNQRETVDWATADRLLCATGQKLHDLVPWPMPMYATGVSEDMLTVGDDWPFFS